MQIDALLSGAPSRAAWVEIAAAIERAASSAELPALLAKVEKASWPAKVRMAPWHWINELVAGKLPMEALRVCSSLSLAPALGEHCYSSASYESLTKWVSSLGAECPALEGLHLGFTTSSRPPDVEVDPYAAHYDKKLIEALLKSPLASRLRVLDLSLEIPADEPPDGSQDTLNGRGIRLDEVARWLAKPDALVALDLHGQYLEPGRYAATIKPAHPALPALEALNLGGGHPYNTKDIEYLAKRLAKSAVTSLHVAAGPVIEFQGKEELADTADYWRVSDSASLTTSADSLRKLLKAVPGMKSLIVSKWYKDEDEFQALAKDHPDVVEFRLQYSTSDEFASDWGKYFETT